MKKDILTTDNIELNRQAATWEGAVRHAGEILVRNGYVEEAYVEKMLEREEVNSTYMGNFLAIPHGTEDAMQHIKTTGISIVTIPEGVDFAGGNTVKVLFGIAGENNEHLDLLSNIAIVCSDLKAIDRIVNAKSEQEIIDLFSEAE